MDMNEQKPKTTPKDFFLYAWVMVLLYGSIIALINLLFAYINFSFPDELADYYDPFSGAIRWAMAFLIILFPAYLIGTWYINKDLRAHPEKDSIGIRKWLTFLALFLAGLAILVDLSVLVYTLLGGEVTIRFILKVLAVFAIAAYALSYYLLDVRGHIAKNPKLGHTFGGIAAALVLLSIIAGFFIVGSPATQRSLRFDQERVTDLQGIQWQIVNYWQKTERFPKSLEDLEDPISGYSVPKDPDTDLPYELRLGEGYAFELCATFDLLSRDLNGREEISLVYPYGEKTAESWKHPAGHYCFERVLDPELYPPYEKTPTRI